MQFTEHGLTLIRDTVRSEPLGPLEYRRVAGLGLMYIARIDAPSHDNFPQLMTLRIDTALYKLCCRNMRSPKEMSAADPNIGKPVAENSKQSVKLKLVT